MTLLLSTPPEGANFYPNALRAVALSSAVSRSLQELAVKVISFSARPAFLRLNSSPRLKSGRMLIVFINNVGRCRQHGEDGQILVGDSPSLCGRPASRGLLSGMLFYSCSRPSRMLVLECSYTKTNMISFFNSLDAASGRGTLDRCCDFGRDPFARIGL